MTLWTEWRMPPATDATMSDEWEPPEGYCRNGAHYIGDSDGCGLCDLWEMELAKGRVFSQARDALKFRRWLELNTRDYPPK